MLVYAREQSLVRIRAMRFLILLTLLAPTSALAQATILSGAKTCREAQRNCIKLCSVYPGSGNGDCRRTCAQTKADCLTSGCFNTGVQFDCGLKP